jgi:hypothetical protein
MAKSLIRDIIVKKKQVLKESSGKISRDAWDEVIRDGTKGAEKKEGKKFGFPHLKSKFKFVLGFIALGILIGAALILLNKFSSIAVEITPRQEFVDVDFIFNASVEPQKGELFLEVMKLSRAEERTALSTGIKQVLRKASGQVVIYNAYTSQPQSLIAGTRLEAADGKIYRIDKPITIPGAKIEGGKITPSEIEVTLYADKPGEAYNIGLTDFTIPGFKDRIKREQIYGRSKTEMKGGFVGEVSVVAENDINVLESSLKEKIRDYLLKTVGNPKPDEFLLYDDGRQIVFDERENMPKIGEETNMFKIKESAVLFGFLLKKSDVNRVLGEKYFDLETAQRIEVVNVSNLDFELKKFTAVNITFGLKGKAHFVWKVDETSLKDDLTKERKNPESVFQRYPVIERAKIIFKPGWWCYIPKNSSRIDIQRILENNP